MPYQIVVTIDDKETTTDAVKTMVTFINEALGRMQVSSFSVDCFRDGMKVMMGLESAPEEAKPSEQEKQ
ncbi:MAG: hypothetical protein QXJ74_07185 [Nitrososphaera sp.]|uniref:hypothetical protein n=1 Tax=Nitrososphaera sp. TaxID=1971748 RepID=UPI0017E73382|nr:hypothetical protein [Nitrososphaera sp.]NWG37147.1 hypothetical protein [Nitrososphaera sp.]